jgi:hypothetical protein
MESLPNNEFLLDNLLQAFPDPPARNPSRPSAPVEGHIDSRPLDAAPNNIKPASLKSNPSPGNAVEAETSSIDLVNGADEAFSLPDFELHYNIFDISSVKDTLDKIVQEISSQRYIHNWDEKLVSDSVKDTAVYAKRELTRNGIGAAGYMINFATVNNVYTTNGINSIKPGPQDPSRMREHFFGTNVSFILRLHEVY